MAIKFTDSDVKSIIASGEPVVIDFSHMVYSCMRMAPRHRRTRRKIRRSRTHRQIQHRRRNRTLRRIPHHVNPHDPLLQKRSADPRPPSCRIAEQSQARRKHRSPPCSLIHTPGLSTDIHKKKTQCQNYEFRHCVFFTLWYGLSPHALPEALQAAPPDDRA